MKVGDWVTLSVLPPWANQLPEESQSVFRFCVGRTWRVTDIDEHGHLILDVSSEVDKWFGGYMNDIRVEPEYVTLAKLE